MIKLFNTRCFKTIQITGTSNNKTYIEIFWINNDGKSLEKILMLGKQKQLEKRLRVIKVDRYITVAQIKYGSDFGIIPVEVGKDNVKSDWVVTFQENLIYVSS